MEHDFFLETSLKDKEMLIVCWMLTYSIYHNETVNWSFEEVKDKKIIKITIKEKNGPFKSKNKEWFVNKDKLRVFLGSLTDKMMELNKGDEQK